MHVYLARSKPWAGVVADGALMPAWLCRKEQWRILVLNIELHDNFPRTEPSGWGCGLRRPNKCWAAQEDAARKAALYQSPSARSMGSAASGSSESLAACDPGAPRDAKTLRGARERPPQAELPPMRGFTFLRLTAELLTAPYEATFCRFVQRMRGAAAPPSPPAAGSGSNPNPGNPAAEPAAPGAGSPPAGRVGGNPNSDPGAEGFRVLEPAAMQAEAMRSYSGSGVFVANAAGEMVPVEALEAGYGSPQGPSLNPGAGTPGSG